MALCTTNKCPSYPDASCIVYTGANLVCSGIKTNDRLDSILSKIDSKLCSAQLFTLNTDNSTNIILSGVGTIGDPLMATSILSTQEGQAIQSLADGLYVSQTNDEGAMEVVGTFGGISVSVEPRMIVVQIDETNNDDSSLYVYDGNTLRFLLTLPAL